MKTQKRNDFICYAFLIATLIIIHYIFVLWPDTGMLESQRALFSWKAIGIVGLLGLASLFLLNLTGLRKLWDANVGIKQKILYPVVAGLLLGSLHSGYDMLTGAASEIAAHMGLEDIHIDFPFSIPVYLGGAILVNIIYYLIPIPILVYLVSKLIMKGKAEGIVFWTTGILIALFEPLTNPGISVIQEVGMVVLPLSFSVLVFNLLSILFIRKYGFIASIFFRIGFYTVWHVTYPVIS